MTIHVVKSGETLSGIAKKFGLKSWQELYNHPSNSAFRAKRPNPNLIYPGDQVLIPGKPGAPAPPAMAGAAVGANAAQLGKFGRHQAAMQSELQKGLAGQQQKAMEEGFFKFLEDTKQDWDKAIFLSDRAEDAVKIVQYYKAMRALQLPLSDIKGIVPIITKVQEGDAFIKAVITPGGKFGQVLKTFATTGKVVGFVGAGIQVVVHWRRQDYYACASEIYKSAMGLGIPWAGLVDGVEGFVSALAGPSPNPKRDERFWKYLKALNLVGLGATAFDTVGTMIHVIVSKDMDPQRMDRLMERLRNSPAQVFLELGEDLNKALTYFEQMPEHEFRKAMTISNFVNWIRYEITGKLPGE